MDKSVAIVGTRGYPSYYGGFETAVRHLAPYLADCGWSVAVYGRPSIDRGASPRPMDPRVRSILTPGLETRSFSTLSYGLTASIHSAVSKPDVALVMNVANGYWLPFFTARGVPTVVNVDGVEWERDKWGSVAKEVFKVGARLTARFATHLIYDSVELGRLWRREFAVEGQFIPYGGDVPGHLPVEPGLQKGKYVLLVARLVPENTVDEFLIAAEELARNVPVVIVGTSGYGGVLDERVEALANSHSDVVWLRQISDDRRLFALWQHAGVYFHGHSVGGTNPALVQAMACGVPIVARDTAFNREVLGPDGEYVAADPIQIRGSILALLNDEPWQEAMSRAFIERAATVYSWDQVCARYEDVLSGARSSR